MILLFFICLISFSSISSSYNKAENNNNLIDNTRECPVDWYYLNGRCILYSYIHVNFANAVKACANYSATLASVHSLAEARALYGYNDWRTKNHKLYIGLHCSSEKEGDPYVNTDGSQPDWSSWSSDNKQWGACTITYSVSGYEPYLWRVDCNDNFEGYICQISTKNWQQQKNDLELKANAQILQNYTNIYSDLESIKTEFNEIYQIINNKTTYI